MKTIICSHGFGVKADSRGMFTDIAASFPDFKFMLFDYNDERTSGDTYVRSLDEMAAVLQKQIDTAEGEVVLLCHSLGCVVAGLADFSQVSKVILLAPPVRISKQHFVIMLKSREGSMFNPNGMSALPRSDSSTTYLPKEFFDSIEAVSPMDLYQKIAKSKPTIIIRALRDEMVGLTNMNEIKSRKLIDLNSDHNFTGDKRQKLIDTLNVIF